MPRDKKADDINNIDFLKEQQSIRKKGGGHYGPQCFEVYKPLELVVSKSDAQTA